MKTIRIFGDRYRVRKTYDIDEFGVGVYGYEVYEEDERFLWYFGGVDSLTRLREYIRITFYKYYESTYSNH